MNVTEYWQLRALLAETRNDSISEDRDNLIALLNLAETRMAGMHKTIGILLDMSESMEVRLEMYEATYGSIVIQ